MRLLLTLAVALSFGALVACGGGEDDDSPTATIDPSLPDQRQVELTLQRYAAALDSEDWDAVCTFFAQEILTTFSCADIIASFQNSAATAGTTDVRVRITPQVIDQDGFQGRATYQICVAFGDNTETCSVETARVVKEAEGWKIGEKIPDSPTPSPAAG